MKYELLRCGLFVDELHRLDAGLLVSRRDVQLAFHLSVISASRASTTFRYAIGKDQFAFSSSQRESLETGAQSFIHANQNRAYVSILPKFIE